MVCAGPKGRWKYWIDLTPPVCTCVRLCTHVRACMCVCQRAPCSSLCFSTTWVLEIGLQVLRLKSRHFSQLSQPAGPRFLNFKTWGCDCVSGWFQNHHVVRLALHLWSSCVYLPSVGHAWRYHAHLLWLLDWLTEDLCTFMRCDEEVVKAAHVPCHQGCTCAAPNRERLL